MFKKLPQDLYGRLMVIKSFTSSTHVKFPIPELIYRDIGTKRFRSDVNIIKFLKILFCYLLNISESFTSTKRAPVNCLFIQKSGFHIFILSLALLVCPQNDQLSWYIFISRLFQFYSNSVENVRHKIGL
jgi:hypothetical protein